MYDAPSKQERFSEMHRYATKYVYPIFEEVVPAITSRISALEQRDALRKVAREALRDAGRKATDAEIEGIVDSFVQKRFTARHASAEPAIVFGPGISIKCPSGRWLVYDDMIKNAGSSAVLQRDIDPQTLHTAPLGPIPPGMIADAEQTIDAERRIAAHARHLKNLDSRLKKVEREP